MQPRRWYCKKAGSATGRTPAVRRDASQFVPLACLTWLRSDTAMTQRGLAKPCAHRPNDDLAGAARRQRGPLAVTEPWVVEVLVGARSDVRENDLRRLLLRFELAALDPTADFEAAARIYRRRRRTGVTPRGLIECLIAAVWWRRGATLLAQDFDLRRVAEVIGVAMDVSPGRS